MIVKQHDSESATSLMPASWKPHDTESATSLIAASYKPIGREPHDSDSESA